MRVFLAALVVLGLVSLSQWQEVKAAPFPPFSSSEVDNPSIRVRPIVDIAAARLLDRALCASREAVFPIRWLAPLALLECRTGIHVLEVSSPGREPAVVVLPSLPTRPPGWSSRPLDAAESSLVDQALRLHFQRRSPLPPFRLTWSGCISLRGEILEVESLGLDVLVGRGLLHADLLPEVELAWSEISRRLKGAMRC